MVEQDKTQLEAINAELLQIWQAIKLSGWTLRIATDLAGRLAILAQVCGQNHWSGLGDRVLDIEVYLSSFADGDLVPDKGQLQVLLGLIRDCRSTIRTTQRDESRVSRQQTKNSRKRGRPADGQGKTAFILKSDEDKYAELSTALGSHQFIVRPFVNTESLLSALETTNPSVLILQRQFLDALDSIDRILYRDLDNETEHTAIIVLSTDNSPEERLKAMRAGVDAFIPEPFTEAAVLARVESLMTDDHVSPFRVLIIDDDRQQAVICSAILRRKGMLTQVCTSGQEGLDSLSEFEPDLMVVDLHMPEMDGLQFTAHVREQQNFFTIPIIFLSGDDDPQTRFDALSLGGNDFLIKPIRPNHLIAAVWSRLKFSRKLRRYLGHPEEKDETTGMYQFSRLLELGEELFEKGSSERRAYLFQIGLDNVEELEERFGATEILELQQHLASFIVSQFRKLDVVASQRYFLFSALVEDLSEQQAGELAERMLGQVKGRLLHLDRFTLATSLSLGICRLVDSIGDINHAVRLAAEACREASGNGGNRWVIHEVAETRVENQVDDFLQSIENDERSAVNRIMFQPLARLHGRAIDQYRLGLWLVTEAEPESDLAELDMSSLDQPVRVRVDLWLLAHGLERVRLTESEDTGVLVRASLDLATLIDDTFVEFVEGALDSSGIEASRLTLVLSRNLVMGAVDNLVEVVESVHKLGVKIALEGITGRKTELEFIQRFPIASVELDHAQLPSRSKASASGDQVESTIRTLHTLGVEVIMSGIDDADDLGALWSWGVDYACGDFIQPPMKRANYEFD